MVLLTGHTRATMIPLAFRTRLSLSLYGQAGVGAKATHRLSPQAPVRPTVDESRLTSTLGTTDAIESAGMCGDGSTRVRLGSRRLR